MNKVSFSFMPNAKGLSIALIVVAFAAAATNAMAVECRQGSSGAKIHNEKTSGTLNGAKYEGCYTEYRINSDDVMSDTDIIASASTTYNTVVGAKVACNKFKDKKENTHVRAAFNKAQGILLPNFSLNPTYQCNRSSRTNNYTVSYKHSVN